MICVGKNGLYNGHEVVYFIEYLILFFFFRLEKKFNKLVMKIKQKSRCLFDFKFKQLNIGNGSELMKFMCVFMYVCINI